MRVNLSYGLLLPALLLLVGASTTPFSEPGAGFVDIPFELYSLSGFSAVIPDVFAQASPTIDVTITPPNLVIPDVATITENNISNGSRSGNEIYTNLAFIVFDVTFDVPINTVPGITHLETTSDEGAVASLSCPSQPTDTCTITVFAAFGGSDGSITIQIPENAVTAADDPDSGNMASEEFTIHFDMTPPTIARFDTSSTIRHDTLSQFDDASPTVAPLVVFVPNTIPFPLHEFIFTIVVDFSEPIHPNTHFGADIIGSSVPIRSGSGPIGNAVLDPQDGNCNFGPPGAADDDYSCLIWTIRDLIPSAFDIFLEPAVVRDRAGNELAITSDESLSIAIRPDPPKPTFRANYTTGNNNVIQLEPDGINRVNVTSINFTITFDRYVVNLDAGDFSLTTTLDTTSGTVGNTAGSADISPSQFLPRDVIVRTLNPGVFRDYFPHADFVLEYMPDAVSPGDTSVTLTLDSNSAYEFRDGAGNENPITTRGNRPNPLTMVPYTIVFDQTPPSLLDARTTFSDTDGAEIPPPTSSANEVDGDIPIVATLTFSESISDNGFVPADITPQTGIEITDVSLAPIPGDPESKTRYNVTIDPDNAHGSYTLEIPVGAINDTAGNLNTAAFEIGTLHFNDGAQVLDFTASAMLDDGTMKSLANKSRAPGGDINFTVTFDEPVTITGTHAISTISNISSSSPITDIRSSVRGPSGNNMLSTIWSFVVEYDPSPPTTNTPVVFQIPTNFAFNSPAANGNLASSSPFVLFFDNTAPTATFTIKNLGGVAISPGSTVFGTLDLQVNITFSEPIDFTTPFEMNNITMLNPASADTITIGAVSEVTGDDITPNTVYTFTINAVDAMGGLVLTTPENTIFDLAGNTHVPPVPPTGAVVNLVFSTVRPTVTLTAVDAASNAVTNNTHIDSTSVAFTAVFSTNVFLEGTGEAASRQINEILVDGLGEVASITPFALDGSSTTTFTFMVSRIKDGDVTVQIPARTVTEGTTGTGIGNAASKPFIFVFDVDPPEISDVTTRPATTTNGDMISGLAPIEFNVTFNKQVAGFDAVADISVTSPDSSVDTSSDISVTAPTAIDGSDNTKYTFTVTTSNDPSGQIKLAIPAGVLMNAITDKVNEPLDIRTLNIDSLIPRIFLFEATNLNTSEAVISGQAEQIDSNTHLLFSATFNKAINATTFTLDDIQFEGISRNDVFADNLVEAPGPSVVPPNTRYNFTVNATNAGGDVVVRIQTGTVADLVGHTLPADITFTVPYDDSGLNPRVSLISVAETDGTNVIGGTLEGENPVTTKVNVRVTIQFDTEIINPGTSATIEDIVTVTSDDTSTQGFLTLSIPSQEGVPSDSFVFDVSYSNTAVYPDAKISVTVNPNVIPQRDNPARTNFQSDPFFFTYDATPPVNVSSIQVPSGGITGADEVKINVTFGAQGVRNFDAGDITVTPTPSSSSGNGIELVSDSVRIIEENVNYTRYEFTLRYTGSGDQPVSITISQGAGISTRHGGNPTDALETPYTFTFDKSSPVIAPSGITTKPPGVDEGVAVLAGSMIQFNITFTEPVTDFDDVGDISIDGIAGVSAIGLRAITDSKYSFTIAYDDPADRTTGDVTITIPPNSFVDTRGNPNELITVRTFSFTIGGDAISNPADTTTPTFPNTPDGITAEATSSAGANVMFATPMASDSPGDIFVVTCDPPSNSLFSFVPPVSTVTCTVRDSGGNTATTQFTVTIQDTTPPEFPPTINNVTQEAVSPTDNVVNFILPTATDIVDQDVDVECTPDSGSTFVLGNTTVDCTATDDAGLTATADFVVSVRDTTAPTFTSVPEDIVREPTASGEGGVPITFTIPTAEDAIDTTNPAVTCDPASGSLFGLGTTTVTCTATDTSGNVGSIEFTVSIGIPPAFTTIPPNITRSAVSSDGAVVTFVAPTATSEMGDAVVVTCDPRSGSTFPVGNTTVTCTAEDAQNLRSTVNFVISVVDDVPPQFVRSSIPANIIQPTDTTEAIVMFDLPTATDIVDQDVNVDCMPSSGSTFSLGTTTVTCTATDDAGLVDTATFTVLVAVAPTVMISSLAVNDDDGLANTNDVIFMVTFGDSIDPASVYTTGTGPRDVVVTGDAVASALRPVSDSSSSGTQYQFTVTRGSTDGQVTVQIPQNAVSSINSGLGNVASDTFTFTFDTLKPSVSITTTSQMAGTGFIPTAETIRLEVVFTESIRRFVTVNNNNDIINITGSVLQSSVTAPIISRTAASADNTTYTFDIAFTQQHEGRLDVQILDGVATDAAGNPNLASVGDPLSFYIDSPVKNTGEIFGLDDTIQNGDSVTAGEPIFLRLQIFSQGVDLSPFSLEDIILSGDAFEAGGIQLDLGDESGQFQVISTPSTTGNLVMTIPTGSITSSIPSEDVVFTLNFEARPVIRTSVSDGGGKTTPLLASQMISYNACSPNQDTVVRVLTFNLPRIDTIQANLYTSEFVSYGVDVTAQVPVSTYLENINPGYVYTIFDAKLPAGTEKFFVTVFDVDNTRWTTSTLIDLTGVQALSSLSSSSSSKCADTVFPHDLKDSSARFIKPIEPLGLDTLPVTLEQLRVKSLNEPIPAFERPDIPPPVVETLPPADVVDDTNNNNQGDTTPSSPQTLTQTRTSGSNANNNNNNVQTPSPTVTTATTNGPDGGSDATNPVTTAPPPQNPTTPNTLPTLPATAANDDSSDTTTTTATPTNTLPTSSLLDVLRSQQQQQLKNNIIKTPTTGLEETLDTVTSPPVEPLLPEDILSTGVDDNDDSSSTADVDTPPSPLTSPPISYEPPTDSSSGILTITPPNVSSTIDSFTKDKKAEAESALSRFTSWLSGIFGFS